MYDIENRPVEDIEETTLNDFEKGFDEMLEDVELEEVDKPVETEDDNKEQEEQEINQEEQKEEQKNELDFSPFLEELSKKIKFKDEEIKINNIEDLITNYQKGMKLEEVQNSEEMQYIKELADQNGMTTKDYISAVKQWNKDQEQKQEQDELKRMVENGVPEDIAQKVIENNRVAREIKEEKARIEKEKQVKAEEEKKTAEFKEFLNAFPDVNIKEIPKEVLENAKKSNLKIAYTEFENAKLKKELQEIKQQETNKKTSPDTSVTKHGTVDNIKIDPFIKGFDEEF